MLFAFPKTGESQQLVYRFSKRCLFLVKAAEGWYRKACEGWKSFSNRGLHQPRLVETSTGLGSVVCVPLEFQKVIFNCKGWRRLVDV